RRMRPVCLPPAPQGDQIPGEGDASNQGKESIEATFQQLDRAHVKTVYQDVGAASKQDDCNDGQGNGNTLFLVTMEGATA
ncbi:MAG: hypothetical protein WBP91_09805, partial [Terriglobales bacterium]